MTMSSRSASLAPRPPLVVPGGGGEGDCEAGDGGQRGRPPQGLPPRLPERRAIPLDRPLRHRR